MNNHKSYCFCGVGGSGMMPLAVLLQKSGHRIVGSDRSYDQGKTPEKFKALQESGIDILSQDGTAVTDDIDVLVVSSAIEDAIPDVTRAKALNIPILTRGQILAECFNTAEHKIAIAGTSGKSTVTGMVATMLAEMGEDPTVVNGGEIRNFQNGAADKFSGIRKGRDDLFVAEMDESDGSIAHYTPSIALLNNVALDHKTMQELEQLFGDYLGRASMAVIVNYDQPRVKHLCEMRSRTRIISYGIDDEFANLVALDLVPRAYGISFSLKAYGKIYPVTLNVPGRHNVENALAALAVCFALGLDAGKAIAGIEAFKGIHRRMEYIGTSGGISVIDDFAHNPDKISASLQALKSFDGRLIVMFQPHGFGPLRLMRQELVDAFKIYMGADDILLMPEAYYAGGTVDRSVTAKHLIDDLTAKDVQAHWFAMRDEIPSFIKDNAKEGDRIVIMGARDDTLHSFAHSVLKLF
ncbi:MAG: UDP-N-acetylmuramate--alanine ligase [Alphaproteobacteria bacterium]|nr:MAG: UDP-N-acetylmuramate--alanine ligase [Alphaproteobacteria bacterium]